MSKESLTFAKVWIQSRIDSPQCPISEDEQTLSIVLDLFRALGVNAEREAAADEFAELRQELAQAKATIEGLGALASAAGLPGSQSVSGGEGVAAKKSLGLPDAGPGQT